MRYKFQRKNGSLFEGNVEIAIKNHLAEIKPEDITPAIELVIAANGGQLIDDKEIKSKPGKGQRKVKPMKWTKEKEVIK